MAYDPGDVWTPELTVKDADGVLTAATVTLSVTSPSGTVTTPTTSTASTGVYTASVPLTEAGRWLATWTVAGALTGVETQDVYVRRLGSNIIPLADVKARLNKQLTVDDDELRDMLDAALAEYELLIGPVSGTVTERHNGGGTILVLRSSNVAAITSAAYSDGTTITLADLDLDTATGIVHWGWNTAGMFSYGTRNVTITYTVGALPASHREIIIADVAGYFEVTQRGGGSLRPSFPGEGEYDAAYAATPAELFPRIAALAKKIPSVA